MRTGFNRVQRSFHKLNNQIRASEIRLIDETGKQIGVMGISDALTLSQEKEMDLVEIAPQAQPPVVKLIDYKKFLYQEKKRKQEEKRHAHVSETKQIRFKPFIDDYDLDIKVKRAKEFIAQGDKVKFIIRFQGRAITKQDLGREALNKVIQKMSEVAHVDREIHMEGRQMVVVLVKGRSASAEGQTERKQDSNEEVQSKNQEVSIKQV